VTENTEYKNNATQEEIDSLAAVLFDEIKAFYETEQGKRMYAEYLRSKGNDAA